MSFAKNLRSELIYNDIQIKELAGKVDIPYSTLLSYIEKNERIPRVDVAVKIAQVLGISVEILVLEEPPSTSNIEKKIQRNLYNDIGILPLEIQKSLLFLIKSIVNNIIKE